MRQVYGRGAVCIIFLTCIAGCYHQYLAVARPDPITVAGRKTVHSYLWGLLHKQDSVKVCERTNAIDQIEVSSNFGMALVTVFSLGIVVPTKVTWYCAKPAERVDSL